MDMRSFGLAQLCCQPALQAEGGQLGGKLDHQYRIGKASQRIGAIDAPGDEQKWQARSQPQQKAEDIGPPALGQRGDIFLAFVSGWRAVQCGCTSRA